VYLSTVAPRFFYIRKALTSGSTATPRLRNILVPKPYLPLLPHTLLHSVRLAPPPHFHTHLQCSKLLYSLHRTVVRQPSRQRYRSTSLVYSAASFPPHHNKNIASASRHLHAFLPRKIASQCTIFHCNHSLCKQLAQSLLLPSTFPPTTLVAISMQTAQRSSATRRDTLRP
jgi:hypothetical protein